MDSRVPGCAGHGLGNPLPGLGIPNGNDERAVQEVSVRTVVSQYWIPQKFTAPAGPVQKTGDPVTAAQYDIRHHFCVAACPNQDYRFALHSASSSSFVFSAIFAASWVITDIG
jgi:hypothetical protein